MLETPAVVVNVDADSAWVESDFGGGCGSGMCAKGGCGTATLAQLFSRRPRGPLQVANPIQAKAGERVVVGVGEGVLLRSAALAYLLPLAGLFIGALALLPHGDGAAALGGAGGLALGWMSARWLGRSAGSASQPVILRRI